MGMLAMAKKFGVPSFALCFKTIQKRRKRRMKFA